MAVITRAAFYMCLQILTFTAVAEGGDERCALPSGLGDQIAMRYPGAELVRSSDLSDSNKDILKQEPAGSCPGLVRLNFYGDKKPTWALALKRRGRNSATELVVARKTGALWEIRVLDKVGSDSDTPVIWEQGPQEYTDVYGEKTIRARSDVVIVWVDDSVAMLYAWTGTRVEKIWIRD